MAVGFFDTQDVTENASHYDIPLNELDATCLSSCDSKTVSPADSLPSDQRVPFSAIHWTDCLLTFTWTTKTVFGISMLLVGLLSPVSAADLPSCTTSSDLEGQPASVTCHFPEGISVSRDDFHVYKYDFDHQHYLPEIVGECYWYDGQNTPHCGTVDGFQFDGPISDTVTLKVAVSSQHHAGVYRCDYINQHYSPEHGCDMYIRGRTISCTGATVYEGEPADVTCHYNSDLSVTHDDFYIEHRGPGHHHHRDVLACLWFEPNLTKPDCFVHPAFKLTDKVSRNVTIHIPAANQSHVGRYFCDIHPTRREVSRSLCHVEVKDSSPSIAVLWNDLLPALTWATEKVFRIGLLLVGLISPVLPSCTTSSDLEGQPASVTCHFPGDISVSRDHFHVYRYDFDRQHQLPEIVGACYWFDGQITPHCGTAGGFQFDGPISDTVTLTKPVSSQHHAGVYRCDYINQKYSPEHGCDMYIRGRTISCTGATVYEGEPANVTCHYNSDLSVTHDDFYIERRGPGHHHQRNVLTCLWLERNLTKPDCSVHPDFKLSDEISRTVTIHIPAANQSHVGRYFCDNTPTRRQITKTNCYIEVKDHITTTASGESSENTTEHGEAKVTTAWIPVVCVLALVVVLLCVVYMIFKFGRGGF